MSVLRWPHDRHRGVRTVGATARTARHNGNGPGDRPMTRHGMVQTSAVGTQPPATSPRALMVIIETDRAAPSRAPGRQPAQRHNEAVFHIHPAATPTAVAPSLTPAEIRNPHSHRPWPAGSFLGDFRTPAGARNSSREETDCSWRPRRNCRRSINTFNSPGGLPHPPLESGGLLKSARRSRPMHARSLRAWLTRSAPFRHVLHVVLKGSRRLATPSPGSQALGMKPLSDASCLR